MSHDHWTRSKARGQKRRHEELQDEQKQEQDTVLAKKPKADGKEEKKIDTPVAVRIVPDEHHADWLEIWVPSNQGEVVSTKAILDHLGIHLSNEAKRADVKQLQAQGHPGCCNFGCHEYWTPEGQQQVLSGEGGTLLYTRPHCGHVFHHYCLRLHYFWTMLVARGGNAANTERLYNIRKPDQWQVPEDFCAICQRRQVFSCPNGLDKYITYPVDLGTIIGRPHFSKAHLEVLRDKCQMGDLLDLGGYRFRNVVGLNANRVWIQMEWDDKDNALIPRDFWKQRGKKYYEDLCPRYFRSLAVFDKRNSTDWLMPLSLE